MTSTISADVAVVGNGLVGLATALEIAGRAGDLSVCVVGPERREGGASVAAGAMLGCFGEVTKYTLASEPGRIKFQLGLAAREKWPSFMERLGEGGSGHVELTAQDTYVIVNGRSGTLDDDNFASVVGALDLHGEPYDVVDGVPGLDPVPDARPLRIVHLPNEGAIDARRLLVAAEAELRRCRVSLIDASVRTLVAGASSVRLTLNDGTVLDAGHVVLAAGAVTVPLAEQVLGPHQMQPMFCGSGIALLTDRVMGTGFSSVVRSVNRAGSCGLHVVPLGGDSEYFGATNVIFGRPETRPHLGVCHFLMQSVIDQLDQSACYSRIDEVVIGNRPVPFDTFPLLGPTSCDAMTVVSGMYRDGLHAAPLLAELAAATVLEGSNAFPPIFAPERQPLATMTVGESVDEYVVQAVSSAFEGGTSLSRFIHVSELQSVYRPRAEALYDRLGGTFALAPDVLTYLTLTRKSDDDIQSVERYFESRSITNG